MSTVLASTATLARCATPAGLGAHPVATSICKRQMIARTPLIGLVEGAHLHPFMTTARCEGVVELAIVLSRMAPFCTHVGTFLVSGGTSGWGPDGCHPSLSRIHNALAFLVERTMHEMARDGGGRRAPPRAHGRGRLGLTIIERRPGGLRHSSSPSRPRSADTQDFYSLGRSATGR